MVDGNNIRHEAGLPERDINFGFLSIANDGNRNAGPRTEMGKKLNHSQARTVDFSFELYHSLETIEQDEPDIKPDSGSAAELRHGRA